MSKKNRINRLRSLKPGSLIRFTCSKADRFFLRDYDFMDYSYSKFGTRPKCSIEIKTWDIIVAMVVFSRKDHFKVLIDEQEYYMAFSSEQYGHFEVLLVDRPENPWHSLQYDIPKGYSTT